MSTLPRGVQLVHLQERQGAAEFSKAPFPKQEKGVVQMIPS